MNAAEEPQERAGGSNLAESDFSVAPVWTPVSGRYAGPGCFELEILPGEPRPSMPLSEDVAKLGGFSRRLSP
jgi:hypothetical protein